jgi:sugar/nucleoside kinase (ribokinase family)
LAHTLFKCAKQRGSKTYYDTADPNPNAKDIPAFIDQVLKTTQVDILSLNENEAITYAAIIEPSLKEKRSRLSFADLALESARVLARNLSARIDLHTSLFSATLKGQSEVIVPTFKIEVYRATGAGDAWNAGNIYAEHNGLSDECRLMLANAVSACYLTGADGMHPTKEKIASFLKANA